MSDINNKTNEEILELRGIFIEAYDRTILIFGKSNAFGLKEGLPINMILFEISLLFSHLLKEKDDKTIIKALYMFTNYETGINKNNETSFEMNIKYHRDSRDNIQDRLKWVERIVEQLS